MRKPETWERNLYVLWVAQAISSLGFSFFFPFVPLFVQDLGVEDPGQAVLWSGIAGGVGALCMMISAPLWGILGDRYGHKKNVLRALFGSAIVLGLTAFVTDVHQLVAFRIMLGLVSGILVTVMALGSSMAPRHRVPYTIGVLTSASFLGLTVGPFVGGLLADNFGFRPTFVITGVLCASAGLLVMLFVEERFQRPEYQEKLRPHLMAGQFLRMARSHSLAPVLMVLFLVQVGHTMMMPALPVFIGTLSASGAVASSVGLAFSIKGLTGVVSSLVMSWLSRRIGIVPVLIVFFVAGGLLYLPLLLVTSLLHVYVVIGLLGFFIGGMTALSFALVGTSVPEDKRGVGYGVAQSASSLAGGSGPLMGGAIAAMWGLREVFLANSIVLLLTGFVVVRLLDRQVAGAEVGMGQAEPVVDTAGDD